eukprot:PhF_6_TR1078/c1_g1_i1/m.2308
MSRRDCIFWTLVVLGNLFFFFYVAQGPSQTNIDKLDSSDASHALVDANGKDVQPLFDTFIDEPIDFLNDTIHMTFSIKSRRGFLTFSATKYVDETNRNTTYMTAVDLGGGKFAFLSLPRALLVYTSFLNKDSPDRTVDTLQASYRIASLQLKELSLGNGSLPWLPSYLKEKYPDLVQKRSEMESVRTLKDIVKNQCIWFGIITISERGNGITELKGTLQSETCKITHPLRLELDTNRILTIYESLVEYIFGGVVVGV